jgi:hypothetical protein
VWACRHRRYDPAMAVYRVCLLGLARKVEAVLFPAARADTGSLCLGLHARAWIARGEEVPRDRECEACVRRSQYADCGTFLVSRASTHSAVPEALLDFL